MEVRVVDVTRAYLQAFIKEKIHTKAGPEWGEEISGRILHILKSTYGLKISNARWYKELAKLLLKIIFTP